MFRRLRRVGCRTGGPPGAAEGPAVTRPEPELREPDLPVASHDEVSRELKLLVDRREVLVAQRTATINRLRWRIHELDPDGEIVHIHPAILHPGFAALRRRSRKRR